VVIRLYVQLQGRCVYVQSHKAVSPSRAYAKPHTT